MAYAAAAAAPALGAPFQPVSQFSNAQQQQPQQNAFAPPPVQHTRVLSLEGFSPSLKTRDIQAVFAEWEDDRGGFKIKWIDDTSCYLVFADPLTCKHQAHAHPSHSLTLLAGKRAFLTTLANMPMPLVEVEGESDKPAATLRAYTGEDAAAIIASVQQRARARSNAGGLHGRRPSIPANGVVPQYAVDDEPRSQRVDPAGPAGRFIAAGLGRPFAAVAASGSAIASSPPN